MKTGQIMIGDYLQRTYNKEIVKVREVRKNYVYVEGCAYEYEYDELEPIPLTAEILLMNGFERDSKGRIWGEYFEEDENSGLEITVEDKTGDVYWSYNWAEYLILKLKYVHQLQHAMRLCGIDKEIIMEE